MKTTPGLVYAAEALIGILVWWGLAASSGVREGWDAGAYFPWGYGLFAVITAASSWRYGRGWSHGPVIMLAQLIPFLIVVPAALKPLPAGLYLLLALSLPLVCLGAIASWLGSRYSRARQQPQAAGAG